MPSVHLWIQCTVPYLQYGGFPHSEIIGSILICKSPMLIAAYRVLRRQSVPGHPPCALISLIVSAGATGCSDPGISASNVCRSVAAPYTSSSTRFPCSSFDSQLPLSFRSLFLAKFLIAYCFSCAVFKVRLSVLAFAIPENDTEFHLKNNFDSVCRSLSGPALLSLPLLAVLFFSSLFLLMFPSARPRNLRSCFISHVSLERR